MAQKHPKQGLGGQVRGGRGGKGCRQAEPAEQRQAGEGVFGEGQWL